MNRPQYGGAHQQLRKRLIADLERNPGKPCPQPVNGVVCGKPMVASMRLALGHDDLTGGYLGLVHARCNEQAGAIKGNQHRQRTCRKCSRPFQPARKRQRVCDACTPPLAAVSMTARRW